jgi:hypothetical protein
MSARYTEGITEDTLGGSHVIFSCLERVGQVESFEMREESVHSYNLPSNAKKYRTLN